MVRRILISLAAGVLGLDLLVVGGVVGAEPPRPVAVEVRSAPTTSSTLPPTTTTTTAPPPPTPATVAPLVAAGPVSVPRNSYAPEEIRTIGVIEIPKLGLRVAMGQGISMRNIDRGPSHWPGTALPGQPGNVVVMGHRVTRTRPFRNIDQLVPGDEVLFEVGGVRTRYVMTHHEIVTPDRLDIVRQTAEPTGTLFACHPPGSARYRYVVRLKLA
jgi:sortase A